MTWLKQLCQDDTDRLSSARAIALAAALTLCFSTVWLTVVSFWRPEAFGVLTAFGPSLAAMATVGYAANRWATKGGTNE